MTFDRDDTFSYSRSKSGDISISHLGKPVTTLRSKSAAKFWDRIRSASNEQAQQLMARATGNFKRGNEKQN